MTGLVTHKVLRINASSSFLLLIAMIITHRAHKADDIRQKQALLLTIAAGIAFCNVLGHRERKTPKVIRH